MILKGCEYSSGPEYVSYVQVAGCDIPQWRENGEKGRRGQAQAYDPNLGNGNGFGCSKTSFAVLLVQDQPGINETLSHYPLPKMLAIPPCHLLFLGANQWSSSLGLLPPLRASECGLSVCCVPSGMV